MALSSVVKAAIVKSTLGHMSQSEGTRSAGDIWKRVTNKLSITDPNDLHSAMSAVQQGRRIFNAGETLEAADPASPHAKSLPLDYSLNPELGQYGYRVVVQVTDPTTLNSFDERVIVYSDTRLTPDQIRSRAVQHFQLIVGTGTTNPKASEPSSAATITPIITSAGRSE